VSNGELKISAELQIIQQVKAWPNKSANPTFSWRGIEKQRKTVSMAGGLTEVRNCCVLKA
jgi:hypothetical protein